MLGRLSLRSARSSWSRQDLLDIAMGVGAFIVALIELQGVPLDLADLIARPAVTTLIALQTLPVIARRRAPLTAFLIVGLADLSTAFPIWPIHLELAAASHLALQLANYTLSASVPRPIGLGGAVVLIGGLLAAAWVRRDGVGELWMLLFLVVPTFTVAVAGGYIRERRIAAAQLEARARTLEVERDEGARRAAAAERARIARELHDVVAHSMSVMVVQAGAARRIVGKDPERARDALRSIELTGRDGLAELRRLLGVFRRDEPAALVPQPGLRQLDQLVAGFREAGVDVTLTVALDGRALPPGADLSAYRIVQEALTNTLKHAQASSVAVTVRGDTEGIEIEVGDDGRGAEARAGDGRGAGIVGMRERVAFFGGDFRAGPRPGGGYAVWARFPLEPQ